MNDDRREDKIWHVGVVGGSGFIGGHLTLNLLQYGFHLHALSHRRPVDLVSIRGRVQVFDGSIEDEEAMVQCFEGCDVVYHLVGIIVETKTKTFEKTIRLGTERLVAAAKRAGVKRLIFLSALGTDSHAASRYFESKYAAEKTIKHSGLDYVIFRPSIVYGVEDQFINKIARIMKFSPFVPVIGDGLYQFQPLYVEELTAIMAYAADKEFVSKKTYEVAGPDRLTYLDLVDIIQRILNRKRMIVKIPFSVAHAAASILEKVVKPAPLTTDQLSMMRAGNTCDHTLVEREFGVSFAPLEQQLSKYLGKIHNG
jgi:uncharacterized protein YbjT (DUF2867 family)